LRIPSQLFALLLTTLLLGACGFHLRGQTGMPFKSVYVDTANPKTPLIAELRRGLESNQVKLAAAADQADVVLQIVFEISDKQILTLSSSGRVTEFRLIYRVSLRAYDHEKQDWIPAEEMVLRRDYTYDDTKVLAKEAEENLLNQSMRTEMAQQILRRLSRAKPQPQ
jgi:LPS-assembly lipoprotein